MSRAVAAIAIVLTTILSYAASWAIGQPLVVPVLNAAASFPFMFGALKRGDVGLAVARMLVWSLTLAACATLLSYYQPWRTDRLFLRGESYRMEMFAWVMTGRGAESTPSIFIPQQATHAAVFALLALVTGGTLAMPMGAALMNFMGHYVGALAASSARPVATMLLGWHPWAVIRIASFVALGVVLSAPLLARLGRFSFDARGARPIVAWAGAGLVADVLLKWLLAPAWQRLLLHVVGW